jgi:type I restriction enzyme S subunit
MSRHPRLGDFFSNRQEPGRPGLPVMSVTMNDSLVPAAEARKLEIAFIRAVVAGKVG